MVPSLAHRFQDSVLGPAECERNVGSSNSEEEEGMDGKQIKSQTAQQHFSRATGYEFPSRYLMVWK